MKVFKAVLGAVIVCALLFTSACGPETTVSSAVATSRHHGITLTGTMQPAVFQDPASRPPSYMYTLTINPHGLAVPQMVIRLDGLSNWKLLRGNPNASYYEPHVPGAPGGSCAGDDMPRLLFKTIRSAAWAWSYGGRCSANLYMDAANSPRASLTVTVYGNLTRNGTIDRRTKLGTLRYPANEGSSI